MSNEFTRQGRRGDLLIARTSRFLSCTNTLGAEMIEMVVSLLELARSCFAKIVAVS